MFDGWNLIPDANINLHMLYLIPTCFAVFAEYEEYDIHTIYIYTYTYIYIY